MDCGKCDELDKNFTRPRTERSRLKMRGTLSPEDSERLEAEEMAAYHSLTELLIWTHLMQPVGNSSAIRSFSWDSRIKP
jgi:hypothetical protein